MLCANKNVKNENGRHRWLKGYQLMAYYDYNNVCSKENHQMSLVVAARVNSGL